MSDQQNPVTSIGGKIDHSTKLETTGAPGNRNRTQHTPSSNNTRNKPKKAPSTNTNNSRHKPKQTPSSHTNNNKKKPASKQQHPQVSNNHEKSSKPVSTRPPSASRQQKRSGSNQNEATRRTNARPEVKGSNRPATKTKSKQTITGTRGITTKREASLKTDQSSPKIQVSIDENILVADSVITEQVSSSLSKTLTTPQIEPKLPVLSKTPPPAIPHRIRPEQIPGSLVASILLIVLISSSFLFWRDVSDTHLYLYALDPASGHTLAQQDLGGGYQGVTTFTNPISITSSLVFGVHTNHSVSDQQEEVLSLTGKYASWKVESQFSTPLEHGTLSITPDNRVLILYANGLQVMTPRGQALWQMRGDEPTLGTHPFQPVFDSSMLYTVTSASHGVVGAYDLQSGAVLWTQRLDDTLEYAAPFLLNGNTLFIAADHTLYALNKVDGTLLWKVDRPVRTLLMDTTEQSLLVVAGSQGLAALNASTGAIAWAYDGQPLNTQESTHETLMPAQFYQANISSKTHVVYATGIVWDAQQVREQLWMFAVDAVTGNIHWSKRMSTDYTSVDAGRIYPPFVDAVHGLVILQQAQDDNKHNIAAYNASDGTPLWNVQLDGITASATDLLQVSNNSLILLNTQSNKTTALHSLTSLRIVLIAMIILSTVLLLLVWTLPSQSWIKRLRTRLNTLPLYLAYPVKLLQNLWQYSHKAFTLILLIFLILGGAFLSRQLSSSGKYLNQVTSPNGSTQWQHFINSPVQLGLTDNEGSIVLSSAGESVHYLTAVNLDGATQWTSFVSEGEFSIPATSTQPGTVLVALHGRTSPHYQFAPDDPAYTRPLDSLYALYLLDRQTGQSIWQNIIIAPQGQQDTTLLGTDTKFFYVASRATNALPPGVGPVVQLIAVDKTSGNIVWRIFGPGESLSAQTDYGNLLSGGRSIIWQVSNTIYSIDTLLGQIQWRKYIQENLSQVTTREETQMAEIAHVLLITRSDAFHALDLTNGNERWVTANSGDSTTLHLGGVVAGNNTLILYGKSMLQAVDPSDQHIIWRQTQLENIQSLKISDNGTLAYAIVTNIQAGNPTNQGLVALDVKTGTIRWIFHPSDQERFVNAQSDGFQYSKNTLYVTLCSTANHTSCDQNVLYAIDAATGGEEWKFEANAIYDVHVSPGSDIVAFQAINSMWGNFIHRFKS